MFIDRVHSNEGVKRDWVLFVGHVKRFGVVIVHDTIWDLTPDTNWSRPEMGMPLFVDDLRRQGYQVITLDRDCGVSMAQPMIGGIALR